MNVFNHRLTTPNTHMQHPCCVLVLRELNVFREDVAALVKVMECLGQCDHGNRNNMEFTRSGFQCVIYSILLWHWCSFATFAAS